MGEALKMKYDLNLKLGREAIINIIDEQINMLKNPEDTDTIKQIFKNVIRNMDSILSSKEALDELKSKSLYQENEYSKEKNKENIVKAKEILIDYLEDILSNIKSTPTELISYDDVFSKETAILIIKKILNNFYMHIEAMYMNDVRRNGGITKENLDKIKILNEYDVQRILYSLIKPVFPESRLEVSDDTGFSTIRYDIIIEKFSIIIEVKCSRGSMTEKNLIEEIAADIVQYKYTNIFFFIYDKEKIIRNTTAFKDTYNRNFDNKIVSTVIIQPIIL